MSRVHGLLAFYDDECGNSNPSFFVDLSDEAIINWIATQTGYSKSHFYGDQRAIIPTNNVAPTLPPR